MMRFENHREYRSRMEFHSCFDWAWTCEYYFTGFIASYVVHTCTITCTVTCAVFSKSNACNIQLSFMRIVTAQLSKGILSSPIITPSMYGFSRRNASTRKTPQGLQPISALTDKAFYTRVQYQSHNQYSI